MDAAGSKLASFSSRSSGFLFRCSQSLAVLCILQCLASLTMLAVDTPPGSTLGTHHREEVSGTSPNRVISGPDEILIFRERSCL